MILMSLDQSSKVSGVAVAENPGTTFPPNRDDWRLLATQRISKSSNSLDRRLDAIQDELTAIVQATRPTLLTVEEPMPFIKHSVATQIALWRAVDRVISVAHAEGVPYAIIKDTEWRKTCFRPPRPRSREDIKNAAKIIAPRLFPNFDGGEDEAEATCQLYHVTCYPEKYFKKPKKKRGK